MVKKKITRVFKFISFAVTLWVLCIAYAITNLGD